MCCSIEHDEMWLKQQPDLLTDAMPLVHDAGNVMEP